MKLRLTICLFFASSTLIIFLARETAFVEVLAARRPVISTVGGGGPVGYCGDGSLAEGACLNFPVSAVAHGNNKLFIADTFNNRVRWFKSSGSITTVAGNGTSGFCGDGGPATSACLNFPEAVTVDGDRNLLITDTFNNRIRKVDERGMITTVAGNGSAGFCGDNGPAAGACLNFPHSVAADGEDNLYIADTFNHRIRRISKGSITTVAGNGTPAFCGDGGPAIDACLQFPVAVAVDAGGNIFITDVGNQRIRMIHRGTITTVAGNGAMGFCGDGGPARDACLNSPVGIAVDSRGSLFIADSANHRVRQVRPSGTIDTVAGNGTAGFAGDGDFATDARLNGPTGVALDKNDLFIVDQRNSRIRRVR